VTRRLDHGAGVDASNHEIFSIDFPGVGRTLRATRGVPAQNRYPQAPDNRTAIGQRNFHHGSVTTTIADLDDAGLDQIVLLPPLAERKAVIRDVAERVMPLLN
jgi:hypothetical protein